MDELSITSVIKVIFRCQFVMRFKILLFTGLFVATFVAADEADLIKELKEVPPEVEMVVRGAPVPLDEAVQEQVTTGLKTLLQTCRVDSKTSPLAFRKLNGSLPFNWQRATDPLRNTSYLLVSLGKLEKLRAGNKTVYAQKLLLETPQGNWPRKYMVTTDGRSAIQFSRCSGLVVVDIICIPEVLKQLPEDYARACSVLPPKSSELVK